MMGATMPRDYGQCRTAQARADFERLMSLPVNDPNRPKLRDQITLSGPKLETRAKKYCTLAREFQAKPVPIDQRPVPTYAEWLRKACAPRPLQVGPWYVPDYCEDMTQYIRTFNTLHNLKA